ncbi:chitin deacetylase [Quaeritorhiza haematococci]|nr:chitin deacetylase [Quaeritorhiza haematococci]
MVGHTTILLAASCFIVSANPVLAHPQLSPDNHNVNHNHLYRRAPTPQISECVNKGQFAITFDDGPSPFTAQVLDVLRQKNAKATFFINGDNGNNIDTFATEVRRMKDEGHMIASHTFSHPRLLDITDDNVFRGEITKLEDAVRRIANVEIAYFRPPFGEINEKQLGLLGDLGYKASVLWNVDTKDFEHPAATRTNINLSLKAYQDALRNQPRNGQGIPLISLQHDIQPVTANVRGGSNFVAQAVDLVRQAGYQLVTIDECLGDKGGAYTKRTGNAPPLPSPTNAPPPVATGVPCGKTASIKQGDTCFILGQQNGISVPQIQALNPGINCDNLQIGQSVCVAPPGGNPPPPPPPQTLPPNCAKTQTIKAGDICFTLAPQNGLTLNQFLALNPGINCDNLQIGQVRGDRMPRGPLVYSCVIMEIALFALLVTEDPPAVATNHRNLLNRPADKGATSFRSTTATASRGDTE